MELREDRDPGAILQSCCNRLTDGSPGLTLFYIWRAVRSRIATAFLDCVWIAWGLRIVAGWNGKQLNG